jgi:hypothetical protein
MDISQAVSGYITRMVSVGDSAAGTQAAKMKILLLDSETVGLLLSSYSVDCTSNLLQGSHCFDRNDSVGVAEP